MYKSEIISNFEVFKNNHLTEVSLPQMTSKDCAKPGLWTDPQSGLCMRLMHQGPRGRAVGKDPQIQALFVQKLSLIMGEGAHKKKGKHD